MALIGLLDAAAYTLFCLGFYMVGASLANLLLSAIGQALTAALTRFVLGRRLTRAQLGGIACCLAGLAVRSLPPAYFGSGAAAAAGSASGVLQGEHLIGSALVAMAALLYSLLGVAYERLLKGAQKAPPAPEIMWNVSILGGPRGLGS